MMAATMHLRVELLTEPKVETCPKCGHASRVVAIAVLLAGDKLVGGPGEYAKCAEGCDSDALMGTGPLPDDDPDE